ncbi:MAG: hypothetical protein ABR879_01155 [Methanomassiliicoccales archaeon]|jgi:hypothetical protein
MAEERNLHMKLAGAEVFGLLMIAWITLIVAMYGFKAFDLTVGSNLAFVLTNALWVGAALLLATLVSFLNENVILTAVFGVLAFFFIAWSQLPGAPIGVVPMYMAVFVGIALLIATVLSLWQPVRLLPILLIVAAILFFVLGAWLNDFPTNGENSNLRGIVGVFSILVFLIAVYMSIAIGALMVKGKPVLPLLIKK